MSVWRVLSWCAGMLVAAATAAAGQSAPAVPLTLQAAVDQAQARYPAVRASAAEVDAAGADVAIARDAYLPRADLLWQGTRATRNNSAGLLLPHPSIPPITGPVTADTADSAWGSAASMLVSWEPFDFGSRAARVRAARSAREAAQADATLTRLQVGAAAAAAFLQVVAADEAVRAAQAGVARARVLFEVVDARVRGGLRPGAESARARAEVAAAESAEARVRQGAVVARAELARWTGAEQVQLAAAPFLQLPPSGAAASDAAPHPAALGQAARVASARAAEQAAARAFAPRVFVEAVTLMRGSGFGADGLRTAGGVFDLPVRNWGAGVNVTFPLLDLPLLRDRRAAETARLQAADARYAQTRQDLESERRTAEAALDAARRVAALTPVQLEAARAAEEQARARYGAGLGTIADVAETTRLVTEADTANALAVLDVWRARLALAVARGNLTPVLTAP